MATGFRRRNCALVMLDVLGFKHKLDGPDRVAEFERFVAIVEEVLGAFDSKFTPPNPMVGLLRSSDERALLGSDTLVYWQDVSDEVPPCDALVSAATFAIRAIGRGLENGFLLRGAMAVGELLTYDSPEAIAGPVVNECAQEYEAGNWCGCHLTPSASAVLKSTPIDRQHRTVPRFKRFKMPRKNEALSSEQWVLSWVDYLAQILPQYAPYLLDSDLKARILNSREAGQDEQVAIRQFFLERLRLYGDANPIARAKIEATIASISQGP